MLLQADLIVSPVVRETDPKQALIDKAEGWDTDATFVGSIVSITAWRDSCWAACRGSGGGTRALFGRSRARGERFACLIVRCAEVERRAYPVIRIGEELIHPKTARNRVLRRLCRARRRSYASTGVVLQNYFGYKM